jgi:hypothetical protein
MSWLLRVTHISGLLMTTEEMVSEKPKKEKSSTPTVPQEGMY